MTYSHAVLRHRENGSGSEWRALLLTVPLARTPDYEHSPLAGPRLTPNQPIHTLSLQGKAQ